MPPSRRSTSQVRRCLSASFLHVLTGSRRAKDLRRPPPLPEKTTLHGTLANLTIGSMESLAEDEEELELEDEFMPSAQTMRKCAALEVCE